ncbi:MAG: hypothetical protein ABR593_07120 [Candidatus Limnocylindria bacterium]
MAFWTVRRGLSADLTDGSAAKALQPRLESIQLFTTERRIEGWVVALEERVTDVLNRRQSLRLCTEPGADVWEEVDRDDLLLVAPPPMPGKNMRAIHRSKRRVLVLVGPYAVEGIVHLPPGMPLDPYLLRTRQRFMAMTNVVMGVAGDDRDPGETLPVAIVNVHNVHELRALITLA